jgi:hypothetical protein
MLLPVTYLEVVFLSYYVCPNCGERMKSYWRLRKHIVEEHSKKEGSNRSIQQIPAVVKRR